MSVQPSNAQLDALILEVVQPQWRKVAMVVATVGKHCEQQSLLFNSGEVASRIAMLVQNGRLEGAGDLSNWRFSEVRLPPAIEAAA